MLTNFKPGLHTASNHPCGHTAHDKPEAGGDDFDWRLVGQYASCRQRDATGSPYVTKMAKWRSAGSRLL